MIDIILFTIAAPTVLFGVLCVGPTVVGTLYGIAWLVWAGLVTSTLGLLMSLHVFFKGCTYKGSRAPSIGPSLGAGLEFIAGVVGLVLCGATLIAGLVWQFG